MSATGAGGIFISYRRGESRDIAGRLADHLSRSFGDDPVFFDVDAIGPGEDFAEVISRALDACAVLVAVIGPRWLAAADERGGRRLDDPGDLVRLEIGAALAREVLVIPVLVGDAAMPRRGELPEDLAGLAQRNALRIRHDSFRDDAARLVTAIKRVVAATVGGAGARPAEDVSGGTVSQPLARPAPIVVGNIPLEPPAFQTREDMMAWLRAAGPGVSVVHAVTGARGAGKTQAVTGMRGVGKTHLAAAYARECVDAGWRLVAWVNAETLTGAQLGLADVADALGIDRNGVPLETVGRIVRNRLEAGGERSLVVFDNLTHWAQLRPYLPSSGACQVIVTSTVKAPLGRMLDVGLFSAEQSLAFLAERTGHNDQGGAHELAAELGDLPLALAQAAGMIDRQGLTYQEYLQRLRSPDLRDHLPPEEDGDYPRGLAGAILLSIDEVKEDDTTGLCVPLLDLVSLLDSGGVSRRILYQLDPGTTESAVGDALGRLVRASLMTYGGDGSAVPVHRLVTRVVREHDAHEGVLPALGARACALLKTVRHSLGEPRENRTAASEFVLHVTALNANLAQHLKERDAELMQDLRELSEMALQCLVDLGDNAAQAVAIGEPLLLDYQRAFGESDPATLTVGNNLGVAYRATGRPDMAIPVLADTLDRRKRVLGESHPDTLTTMNYLGLAYRAWGDGLDQAISLFEVARRERRRVLGESHPDTLMSANDLAGAYRAKGRLEDAITLFEDTVAKYEQAFDELDEGRLRAQNNLGYAYQQAEGRVHEAIPLLKKALAGRERALGQWHPDTLTTLNDLGCAYLAAGQVDEAVKAFEKTRDKREELLGPLHQGTLTSRHNLGRAYRAQGRLREAIEEFERALRGRVQAIGEKHPNTLMTRRELASARQEAERLNDTE